ncbi:MAG: hypothetical protein ACPHRO_00910 [Nannocystaceae bacterium]
MATILLAIFATFFMLACGVGLFVVRRALRRRSRLRRLGAPRIGGALPAPNAQSDDVDAAMHELSVRTAQLRCELEATVQQATEYTRLHGQLGQSSRTPLWLRVEAEALDHAALLVTRALSEWAEAARAARPVISAGRSLQGGELDRLLEQAAAWIAEAPSEIEDIERLRGLVNGARTLEQDLASRGGTHYR